MTTKSVEQLRTKIDELDRKLFELIQARARLVLALGKEKRRLGIKSHDPEREQAVIERLYQEFEPIFSRDEVAAILEPIFKASLRIQLDDNR